VKSRLVIISMLFLLTGCSILQSSSPAGEGTLLYAAVDQDGSPTGELILSDTGGDVLNRFTIPEEGPFDFISFFPVRAAGIALVRVNSPENDNVFWLDTNSGEIKELALGGSLEFPQYNPSSSFNQYGIFYQTNIEEFQMFLIDLSSGDLTDINDVTGGEETFYAWTFSPDESYLVLLGKTCWILPTASPHDARQIHVAESVHNIDFSSDSSHLLIGIWSDSENQVVLESVDGSESEVIYNPLGRYNQAYFINDEEILLLMEDKTIVFNLSTREEQVLFENGGIVRNIFHLPDEEGVFVNLVGDGTEIEDKISGYIYINTKSGQIETYPELTDMWVLSTGHNPNPDWVYIADNPINATTIKVVNLANGKVVDLFDFEEPATWVYLFGFFSEDSSTASLYYRDSDSSQHAVGINSQKGKSYDLESESYRGTGGTNLENTLLAYVVSSDKNQHRVIKLLDLQNGKIYELGPGMSPVWIMP